MDLLTAVSVSMLSVARARVATFFKNLRQSRPDVSLEHLLDALGAHDEREGGSTALCARARRMAAAAIAEAPRTGMEPIAWFDARYPALLSCVTDPPPVSWIRGDARILGLPTVAIVGSRAATPYALDVASRLAGELAESGIVVASGLARGADSSAHRGCLDAGGGTIAVLGSGIDRVYPPEHQWLAESIAATGAVISELGPGAAPLQEHFPLRNRIISGISLAVVVVEASEKSGSLITARCALEQGRDVMAVPGSVLSGRNRGSHSLLKDGAKVVETAVDILEELGWPVRSEAHNVAQARPKSAKDDPLLARMLAGEEYRLDELVRATGMAASKLLPRLMELELMGLVGAVGGGRFALVPPPR